MKNKLYFVFYFFYENEKRMKELKIQTKNLLSMKMVVNYSNFVFRIEVKTKSKHRILNFVFQFVKNTKWHFEYTDCFSHSNFKIFARPAHHKKASNGSLSDSNLFEK